MLARSVVVRLAADVPRTSTHDLSRASHFAQRTLLSRHGFVASYAALRSHAYRAVLLQYRRSYATSARATKPTPKVKRDVKKAAASKPANKAASKKAGSASSAKKAVKKQAKPKKKKTTTAKPKRVAKKKRELTVEEKELARIRHYKTQALSPPHRPKGSMSAWNAYISEALRGKSREGGHSPITKEETQLQLEKFRNLTPAEREHYNHIANERSAARRAELRAWIHQHTPEEIRLANIARTYLRRKFDGKKGVRVTRWVKLEDDRELKRPLNAFLRFSMDRRASNDFKNIPLAVSGKLVAEEWKALSASEKKKYEDDAAADRVEYERKFEQIYGHPAGSRSPSPSAT